MCVWNEVGVGGGERGREGEGIVGKRRRGGRSGGGREGVGVEEGEGESGRECRERHTLWAPVCVYITGVLRFCLNLSYAENLRCMHKCSCLFLYFHICTQFPL